MLQGYCLAAQEAGDTFLPKGIVWDSCPGPRKGHPHFSFLNILFLPLSTLRPQGNELTRGPPELVRYNTLSLATRRGVGEVSTL
jgi:hypothetical protein